MPTHVSFLQDCCTVLLMYLFSIRARKTSHLLLEKVSQLPFLIRDFPTEEDLTNTETKKLIVELMKVKISKLSTEKAKKKLDDFLNSELFTKAIPFLRPDLRDFLLETISEIVGGRFNEIPCEEESLFHMDPPKNLHLEVFRNRHRPRFPVFQRPTYPVVIDRQNPHFFRESTILKGHKAPLFCLMYDRNGDRILTGSDDYLIKVWDVATGYLIFTLNGHGHKISDFNLFEDGVHLVSCDVEGFLVIWDISKGVIVDKRHVASSPISSVFFTPARYETHASVFATGEDGKTYFLNLKPNFMFEQDHSTNEGLIYKDKKILAGSTNRAGTLLAYGGEDFMIHILMPKLNSSSDQINAALRSTAEKISWGDPQVKFILHGHTFAVASLDFNSDGTRLLSSSQDNSARVWTYNPSLNNWRCVVMGEEIDIIEDDGVVRFLEKDHKIRKEMPTGLENAVCSVAWASDDNFIIVSYDSGHMKIFCSYSGKQLFKCYWFDSPIHVIMAHPIHSDWILCACYSGRVIFWNCKTHETYKKWQFPELMFLQGQFSPKGDHFCLSASNGLCLTFFHTSDKYYKLSAISGQHQSFSHDFVCVPPNASFPVHGTETRRNEFRSYELRNLDCDKYPPELQQPDDFGIQYLVTGIGGQFNEPKTTCNRIKQYKWDSLGLEPDLPKKFQYQKYRREHANLFIDTSVLNALALEPIVLPPSPKDEDYIESSREPSDDDPDSVLSEESSVYTDGSYSSGRRRKPKTRSAIQRSRARKSSHGSSKPYALRERQPSTKSSRSRQDDELSGYDISDENMDIELEIDSYPMVEGFTSDRLWASLVHQEPGNYFPQINDIVVYFRTGHQEYIDTLDESYKAIIGPSSLPVTVYPNLKFNEEGIILGVDFKMIGIRPCVKIIIKFSGGREYFFTIGKDLPRFLTLQQLYVDGSQIPFAVEDQVRVRGSEHPAQHIVSISSEDDPWNAIKLDDGKSYGSWELDLYEQGSIVHPVEIYSLDSTSQQLHMSATHRLARMSKYNCFVDQIEFNLYVTYLDLVACPMFLSLIWLRLKNGYYRSPGAVLDDVELINGNARSFNVPHAKIVSIARRLKKDFSNILKQELSVKESHSLLESALELSKSKVESAVPSPGPSCENGNLVNKPILEEDSGLHEPGSPSSNSSGEEFEPEAGSFKQMSVSEPSEDEESDASITIPRRRKKGRSSEDEEFRPVAKRRSGGRKKDDSTDDEFVPIVKKRPGRPGRPKNVRSSDDDGFESPVRRRPGRPKKVRSSEDEEFEPVVKKRPGRPRRTKKVGSSEDEESKSSVEKRPSRPRRTKKVNSSEEEFEPSAEKRSSRSRRPKKVGSSEDEESESPVPKRPGRPKRVGSSEEEFVPSTKSSGSPNITNLSESGDESISVTGNSKKRRYLSPDKSESERVPKKSNNVSENGLALVNSEDEPIPPASSLKRQKVVASSEDEPAIPTRSSRSKKRITTSDSDAELALSQDESEASTPSTRRSRRLVTKLNTKSPASRSTRSTRLNSVNSASSTDSPGHSNNLRPRKQVNYFTSLDLGISSDEH